MNKISALPGNVLVILFSGIAVSAFLAVLITVIYRISAGLAGGTVDSSKKPPRGPILRRLHGSTKTGTVHKHPIVPALIIVPILALGVTMGFPWCIRWFSVSAI
ncbi:hypothetical protein [Salinispira pacifica]|uniref:Uncharacterized protein n=1 Tax=Salinispira pacifica TaxID=1307761 RepID=V5WIF0_9SPIO|nr:hypothetical protein [Salinispira pacifica]AHC15553.1 hypothetical protein L21SP2_2190 [Salinispira pacifica]